MESLICVVIAAASLWLVIRIAQVVYLRAEIRRFGLETDKLISERVALDLDRIKLSAQIVSLKLQIDDLLAERRAIFLDFCQSQDVDDEGELGAHRVRKLH